MLEYLRAMDKLDLFNYKYEVCSTKEVWSFNDIFIKKNEELEYILLKLYLPNF